MKHVDALSRHPPVNTKSVHHLSPSWQTDSYIPILDLDNWPKSPPPTVPDDYELVQQGNAWFKRKKGGTSEKLWVPPELRNTILYLFHDTPAVGHVGAKRMIGTMNDAVWWIGLNNDVYEYCKQCEVCQRFKGKSSKTPMGKNRVPEECLEEISMDLVGPVPYSRAGTRYVLVIQDKLSRFIVFAPLKDASAEMVARVFLSQWICQFGVPKRIVTDRGTNFMSAVFRRLCEFLGIKHCPTTAYNPQGNAENERSHKELHSYIAMYLSEAGSDNWDLLLGQAAWTHNSTYHSTLGRSPFEVLTGQKPRGIQGFLRRKNIPDEKDEEQEFYGIKQEKLDELRKLTRDIIEQAQEKNIKRANKNCKPTLFQPGDLVWKRTHFLTLPGKKWSAKFDGPFRVKEVIREQVIKIATENDPTWTDIVHAKYLKKVEPEERKFEQEEEELIDLEEVANKEDSQDEISVKLEAVTNDQPKPEIISDPPIITAQQAQQSAEQRRKTMQEILEKTNRMIGRQTPLRETNERNEDIIPEGTPLTSTLDRRQPQRLPMTQVPATSETPSRLQRFTNEVKEMILRRTSDKNTPETRDSATASATPVSQERSRVKRPAAVAAAERIKKTAKHW